MKPEEIKNPTKTLLSYLAEREEQEALAEKQINDLLTDIET